MDKSSEINKACTIGFKDKWVVRIGVPLLGTLMPLFFFSDSKNHSFSENSITIIVSIINTFVFWKMDKQIIIYFRKELPKHKDYLKRLVLQLGVIAIVSFLCIYFLSQIQAFGTFKQRISQPSFGELLGGVYTITFFVIAIYEAMYFFDLWKIEMIENEQLKTENTKAQLDVLKNQINPHFLFNSFNTLVSIIPENQDLAVKFTSELSSFYRFILELKDKELIPLSQELECVESYIYLLKIRFEERLIIDQKIDVASLKKYVVPLSLQILIENATKHNVISKAQPLIISIFIQDNQVCVKNTIQLKESIESTYTGLKNIRERYKLLSKDEIYISDKKQVFQVCLPLINVKKL